MFEEMREMSDDFDKIDTKLKKCIEKKENEFFDYIMKKYGVDDDKTVKPRKKYI